MTETDWLRYTSRPAAMLRQVRNKAPARKLRLIGCACCRIVWEHMPEFAATAVSTVERYHDEAASENEYEAAQRRLWHTFTVTWGQGDPGTAEFGGVAAVYAVMGSEAVEGLEQCVEWVRATASRALPDGEKRAPLARTRRQICDLFREIIGNPFRPWKVVPDFLDGGGVLQPDGTTVKLTDTARQLAEGIRADQAFDRLPILADALEEAGVTDAELLAHCRRDGGHVRGCWALDVVLGKV